MTTHYSGIIDEDAIRKTQEDYDEVFKLHNRSAPRPLEGENETAYRRRMAERLQECAPNCKDFNIRHSTGTAFDTLEKQIKADAAREAQCPTNIPEGELRQVTHYDAAGRPSYTYHGSPSAWMKDFMPDTIKKLKGIIYNRQWIRP